MPGRGRRSSYYTGLLALSRCASKAEKAMRAKFDIAPATTRCWPWAPCHPPTPQPPQKNNHYTMKKSKKQRQYNTNQKIKTKTTTTFLHHHHQDPTLYPLPASPPPHSHPLPSIRSSSSS